MIAQCSQKTFARREIIANFLTMLQETLRLASRRWKKLREKDLEIERSRKSVRLKSGFTDFSAYSVRSNVYTHTRV